MYSIYIYICILYIYIHLPCAQANDSSYDGPQKSQFGPGAKAPGLWAKQLMGLCGERWNGVLLLHRKQCLIMNIMMIN